MSTKPTPSQVEEAIKRYSYLVERTAKQFSNEVAQDRQDYSLETLDYMSAANAALYRAAQEKGADLREGYAKEAMKNSIIDAQRSANVHDPQQIDVEANFLDFYNAYLGGLNKPDSIERRAIAESLWLDLKPGEDESEAEHQLRVKDDIRLETNTKLVVLTSILWKRKLEYNPVPYRVEIDQHIYIDGDDTTLTLEDMIPGADPTKDGSYDAFEVSDISRQIKHFSNRRYVDNSKMVKTIKHLVTVYTQKLNADITDLVSCRAAWRLTLLYLLSIESPELQKRGYEAGTTIKDILIIPDLVHLCHLADFELSNAVKMKPIEAKAFLFRNKRHLGLS